MPVPRIGSRGQGSARYPEPCDGVGCDTKPTSSDGQLTLSQLAPGASEACERLVLALDFASSTACFSFLDRLHAGVPDVLRVRWVKLGLELFLAEGRSLVTRLHGEGYNVFLDLKLHDIPNTVAKAIEVVLPLEPALLTVHASGGPAMLSAAAKAVEGTRTRLVAVTVLTSMNAGQLAATGVSGEPEAQVVRLAQLAQENGIGSLVCSANEVRMLHALLPEVYFITPGIRPAGSAVNDQQRVSSPAQALRDGASQLVVGRPITDALDPAAAYLAILTEMAEALQH